MSRKKTIVFLAVAALVGAFLAFDLQTYLNLEYFQSRREALVTFTERHFILSSLVYFLFYIAVTALSLPAATVLTLAGGAVFGFLWTLVLVSFASSIGATLAFLVARTLLRDWVQHRFGRYLGPINRGVARDGAFYLFSLRLVPAFPFFLINVVMALTPISTATFYLVSQAGMLFGTALYVNVGAQLGQATSVPDILGADIIASLLALAAFPWVARAGLNAWKRGAVMRPYSRPRHFDTNLVVIGAGSAGLVTAYIAALVKASVVMIEKDRAGGDCLNTGCVPSKALIRSASVSHLLRRAREFGLVETGGRVDFRRVMERVRKIIAAIEPNDSMERYTALGVECIQGEARITSPYTVEVNGREIAARAIVLATGARPAVPSIPGLEHARYVTSDTVWELEALPESLLVLGGGPIGCELAQAFARLGSSVTVVERLPRLLPGEDEDASELVARRFGAEGISVMTGCDLQRIETGPEGTVGVIENGAGERFETVFDCLLVAVGRRPNVEGLGLENLDLPLTESGAPAVDEFLQTRYPTIYACGDVIGPWQFTHMASFQAWYAAVNSLFGGLKKFRINYSIVPRATFTDPEVAGVGLNETRAAEQGIACEVTRYDLSDLDRAVIDGEVEGFVKVLTSPGSDRILGAVVVGAHAGDLINEFVIAMTHGLGLKKLMATIRVYPTWSEGSKYAAARWRMQHAPSWLYRWLERFHRRRRG